MKKFLLGLLAAFCICGQAYASGPEYTAGYQKTYIATGTTTLVQTGNGVLHTITVNTIVASATIKLYDGISAVNPFAFITLPATITGDNPVTLVYDVPFTSGLTIVTSGATDVTVTWR